MPVGDVSRFSTVDAALWAGLKETSSSQGSTFDAWRKEQSPSGAARGKDYDTGEVPEITQIPATSCPALFVVTPGATPQGISGPDYLEVAYPKAVVGLLRSTRVEVALDAKVKKFAELAWNLIAFHAADNFLSVTSGTNPVKQVDLGEILFPNLQEPGFFMFTITLGFTIEIAPR